MRHFLLAPVIAVAMLTTNQAAALSRHDIVPPPEESQVEAGAKADPPADQVASPDSDYVRPVKDPRAAKCGADRVQSFIGAVANDRTRTDLTAMAKAKTIRWITPGMAMTSDVRTDRLSIHLNANNNIQLIDCG